MKAATVENTDTISKLEVPKQAQVPSKKVAGATTLTGGVIYNILKQTLKFEISHHYQSLIARKSLNRERSVSYRLYMKFLKDLL